MPLKFAIVDRQRTLAALVRSLYVLNQDPDQQMRAEAALLRANPHLGDDGRPRAGSTLVVPDVPGLATTPAVRRAPLVPGPFTDLERERLERLAKVAERLLVVTAEEAETQRAQLRDRTFVAALGNTHPELRQKLPEIAEAADLDAETLSLRAKQFNEGVKRAQADLERLNARFGLGDTA